VVQILHDRAHPSYVALPTLGAQTQQFSVPNLRRG